MRAGYLCCVIFALCLSLFADEIADKERELSEIQRQRRLLEQQAKEAEELRKAAEQSKQQTQRQLNTTQQSVQQLTTTEQNLSRAVEQSKNLLNQTESKLSQLQASTSQTLLYLLISDQAREKLHIPSDDTYLLSELVKKMFAESKKLSSERQKLTSDATTKERELQQTRTQASTERNKISTITSTLRQLETQITTFEQQKREYQNQADELDRSAKALQDLVNLLKTEEQQYQKTYDFPNGVEAPVSGRVVTQFGPKRNDRYNITTMSNGIDISVPENTPVKAIADGEVAFSDWFTGLGRMIIIDHKNGFHSVYAYNNAIFIPRGATVQKGQVIAESGMTGAASEPLLHFELRRNGTPVNPLDYISIR